ncbi:hypothetical protein GGR50DRAFT_674346, partial [Xylaria sp. CBS 124048]
PTVLRGLGSVDIDARFALDFVGNEGTEYHFLVALRERVLNHGSGGLVFVFFFFFGPIPIPRGRRGRWEVLGEERESNSYKSIKTQFWTSSRRGKKTRVGVGKGQGNSELQYKNDFPLASSQLGQHLLRPSRRLASRHRHVNRFSAAPESF